MLIRANGDEAASNVLAELLFIETEFPLEVGDDILLPSLLRIICPSVDL